MTQAAYVSQIEDDYRYAYEGAEVDLHGTRLLTVDLLTAALAAANGNLSLTDLKKQMEELRDTNPFMQAALREVA